MVVIIVHLVSLVIKARGYVSCVFYFLKDTYSILAYVNKNRIRCNYKTVVKLKQ